MRVCPLPVFILFFSTGKGAKMQLWCTLLKDHVPPHPQKWLESVGKCPSLSSITPYKHACSKTKWAFLVAAPR